MPNLDMFLNRRIGRYGARAQDARGVDRTVFMALRRDPTHIVPLMSRRHYRRRNPLSLSLVPLPEYRFMAVLVRASTALVRMYIETESYVISSRVFVSVCA